MHSFRLENHTKPVVVWVCFLLLMIIRQDQCMEHKLPFLDCPGFVMERETTVRKKICDAIGHFHKQSRKSDEVSLLGVIGWR